jgi:transposase
MESQGLLARRSPMPTPFAPRLILSHNLRTNLQTLAQAHSTPQALALRARIVWRAADADTPKNVQIGRDLHCSNRPVGKWRRRYHEGGFAGLQDASRSGRPRTVSSRTRVTIIAVASQLPQDAGRTVTRWTLDEIVATLRDDLDTDAISRSPLGRILHEVDLKPHKSAYWLNSHDATCASKADAICQLYVQALRAYQQGRFVICCDEKTGMQVRERTALPTPAQPGKRERRAYAYIRHGTRVLINSFVVATGQIAWTIGGHPEEP